jgi:hypothetical protein
MAQGVKMFKVGSMPPKGYVAWHEWADVQAKGGLKQSQCDKCLMWLFPQEIEAHECQSLPISEIRARPTPSAADNATLFPHEHVFIAADGRRRCVICKAPRYR